jgi:hypothetical protein
MTDSSHFKLTERESATPGPRTVVRLDVSEASLPVLLEGINAARCWLVDEGDGLYSFHATQTFGESRKQPGKPAKDLLVELLNEFAEGLHSDEDVPDRLLDKWAEVVERYKAGSAPAKEPSS